ncbi:hypothetical protein HPP92_010455 [Vanilla planifolia]|uniref:Uncharacterized protein n=1 Tax=Vanilla planifolia TaxID=51239 RepID=A0A835R3R5_VANPL|nr:hypothetical protein HPP92_010455 [Vanilla planifolia]
MSHRRCGHGITIVASSASSFLYIISLCAGNFLKDVDIIFGDGRAKIIDDGDLLSLLSTSSRLRLWPKKEYLIGRFDVDIKLIPGNSAAPLPPST